MTKKKQRPPAFNQQGIRRAREARGITQGVLARRVGKGGPWMSKVECGELELRVLDLFAIAAALDLTPAALLEHCDGAWEWTGPL